MGILFLVIGLIVGVVGCFLILKPRLTATQTLDQETAQKNQELKNLNEALITKNTNLLNNNTKLLEEKLSTQARVDELQKSLETLEKQASLSAEALHQFALKTAQESFSNEAEKMANDFQQAQEEYTQEYLSTISEYMKEFGIKAEEKRIEIQQLTEAIKKFENTARAASEAALRDQEKKDKIAFYTLNLSDLDKEEIAKLRSVAPYLRDPEPLNKVIWKTYYEKPYTDLMGRIITSPIGIYKITNLNNNMIYIGQSVTLKDRLKNHIKAGLGIDASKNKLYTAMQNENVENFSFEIMEYCDRTELNEKEKYWIKFYHSDTYGYNMTQGNKS